MLADVAQLVNVDLAGRVASAIEAERAVLSARVEELEERLNIAKRLRQDTHTYDFRKWVRHYEQWKEIDFFKRFLDDSRLHVNQTTGRLMSKVPHSLYLVRLRHYKYSEEDIALFEEAWKDMLFNKM